MKGYTEYRPQENPTNPIGNIPTTHSENRFCLLLASGPWATQLRVRPQGQQMQSLLNWYSKIMRFAHFNIDM